MKRASVAPSREMVAVSGVDAADGRHQEAVDVAAVEVEELLERGRLTGAMKRALRGIS